MDLQSLTVRGLREKLDQKELSAVEVASAYLSRISEKDPDIKSYITVCEESALAQAKEAQ